MKLEKMPPEFLRASPVLEKIQEHQFEAYFVGGSVRDVLLSRAIHDVDIATSAYPEEIKKIFPHTIDVGIEHGTVLVLAGPTEAEHYEVTTFRTESKYTDYRRPDHVDFVRDLAEDLKRRDFTMNALAMNVDGQMIDLFNGISDMEGKIIRAVGLPEERFNEDALRIMRALRFCATLNFGIEKTTFSAMKSHAHLLKKISIERIFIELDKLLLADDWRRGIELLVQSGAWEYLVGFDLTGLSKMLSSLSKDFKFKNSAQAWAALLLNFDEQNIKDFLRKWKVSNEFIMSVTNLVNAYRQENWNLTSLYRFGLENCQLVDDLKAATGRKIDFDKAIKIDQALQIHHKSEIVITGADLMQEFQLKAGPELGKCLKKIEEKIVKNELENERQMILEFVKDKVEN